MALTVYHARYEAFLLSRQKSRGDFKRYLPVLASAAIDLHPHQIEAAVFAGSTSSTEGVILADEDGLGKRVSAGIVLLAEMSEGKKNLLVLCPESLAPSWQKELKNKFGIDQGVTIISYQEVSQHTEILEKTAWDLCVLDEAHELMGTDTAAFLEKALKGRRKLLLTSTPMQNSLLDLYYLMRFADSTTFGGGPELFKQKYVGNKVLKAELAARAQAICQRTLKRQVLTMQFPRRVVRTVLVPPSPPEDALSKRISLYFHRENLIAFPKIQEPYIRLTFWKLLASSIPALRAALGKAEKRLENNPAAADELKDLREVMTQAEAITKTARSEAFLKTLKEIKQEKILVFSENRTTLEFLYGLLTKAGYKTALATPDTADKALQNFKNKAQVLLATDHFAKSYDVPFCSCVINYDVPWNVQKLERRIACCQTYGQKNDVLAVNFIDPTNRADKRLYTVLNKNLKKFDEVFGVSETVLGEVGTDVNADLRTAEEIKTDQEFFTEKHKETIAEQLQQAENDLLVRFDHEVAEKFKFYVAQIPEKIKEAEDTLWNLSKYAIGSQGIFDEEKRQIILSKTVFGGTRLSRLNFRMGADVPRGERYTFASPLAGAVLNQCLDGTLREGSLTLKAGSGFKSGDRGVVGLWSGYAFSKADYMTAPIFCGYMDERELSAEECERLMRLNVIDHSGGRYYLEDPDDKADYNNRREDERLKSLHDQALAKWKNEILIKRDGELQKELDRLEKWAEEEIEALKTLHIQTEETRQELKATKASAGSFKDRFKANKRLADLEKGKERDEDKRAKLAENIHLQKEALIKEAEERITPRVWSSELFTLSFKIE